MVIMLGIKSLEVDPVAGILQKLSIRVNKNVCPLAKAVVNGIWVIPHRFKLPFSQVIVGLVIHEDHITFAKGVRGVSTGSK